VADVFAERIAKPFATDRNPLCIASPLVEQRRLIPTRPASI
jgi:hypothetical protein